METDVHKLAWQYLSCISLNINLLVYLFNAESCQNVDGDHKRGEILYTCSYQQYRSSNSFS